jgi:hypothetical protein
MIKVLNVSNEVKNLDVSGFFSYTVKGADGSALLQMDENDTGFITVAGTDLTVNNGGTLWLPSCQIKAVITGSAVVTLKKINSVN